MKSWMLAGGALLAFSLCAGCDPDAKSESAVVTATYAQNGQSVVLASGGTLVVRLAGNATTGYAWEFSRVDATRLRFLDSRYDPDSSAIGAGGTYTFRFEALQAGATELGLVYRRAWESDPPAATFSLTVVIQEEGTPAFSLEGTRWRLAAWSASSLAAADFAITAVFADGQISGHSAVNTYGGGYSAAADGSFAAGALAMTEMAGPEPAMRAESLYLSLLQQARRWRVDQAQLVLSNATGQDLLIFTPAN